MTSETGDQLREAARLADESEQLQEEQEEITEKLKDPRKSWLIEQPISSHFNIEKKYAQEHSISLSKAREELSINFQKYEVEGKDIPTLIKELKRMHLI